MEEEADAAAIFGNKPEETERPDDARWPEWSGHLQAAFYQLRDDRFYGAMGGIGRIYFHAIDAYAMRQGIEGSAFEDFLNFLRAIDDEYVAVQNERAKAEADKHKTKS